MFQPHYPAHYDELTKDERASLLGEGNSLYTIGGRSTDVRQLAGSLRYEVRNHFPINHVPADVVSALDELDRTMDRAEELMALIVDKMCLHTISTRPKAVK